jgi:uncharacterized membrane protein
MASLDYRGVVTLLPSGLLVLVIGLVAIMGVVIVVIMGVIMVAVMIVILVAIMSRVITRVIVGVIFSGEAIATQQWRKFKELWELQLMATMVRRQKQQYEDSKLGMGYE